MGGSFYPAPVALDCELVLMVDAEHMREGAEPSPESANLSIEVVSPVATDSPRRGLQTAACLFYMRRDDYGDWLLADFNEAPPDWPELDGY